MNLTAGQDDEVTRAPLTSIEQEVYNFLLDHLAEHTFQPSVRDIGRQCKIASTKSVTDLLGSLEAKGYIERAPGRSRGVKLLGHTGPAGVTPVPVLSPVAGQTALVTTAHLALDRSLLPSVECFLVAIPGDEARPLGVHAGDYALVHPVARSRDGEAVVVRLGAMAAVRSLLRRGQAVVLTTGDGTAPTEVGPQDDFAVLGVLAGVIRPPVIPESA
ncbi:MAG: S24 family peptidase [Gemmatimonadota bacterium]|nr:S24 family peptidase [Gemmatimonadota bacterium]